MAHFEPETIQLHGEGIFPRILLNLPRYSVAGEYEQLLCIARENLLKDVNNRPSSTEMHRLNQDQCADLISLVMLMIIIMIIKIMH